MCGGFSCDNMVAGGVGMKKSKRINRNLTVICIIILGFLVYVFGNDVINAANP